MHARVSRIGRRATVGRFVVLSPCRYARWSIGNNAQVVQKGDESGKSTKKSPEQIAKEAKIAREKAALDKLLGKAQAKNTYYAIARCCLPPHTHTHTRAATTTSCPCRPDIMATLFRREAADHVKTTGLKPPLSGSGYPPGVCRVCLSAE